MKELTVIQLRLNAPKGERNQFGGYQYRTCESILRSVKPLLEETGTNIVMSDDLVQLGDRVYVKATATLTNESGEHVTATAYAREAESKKGMDEAQVTGGASSYARKYALCGLLAIDGANDPDRTNVSPQAAASPAVAIQEGEQTAETVSRAILAAKTREEFEALMYGTRKWWTDPIVKQAMQSVAKRLPKKQA